MLNKLKKNNFVLRLSIKALIGLIIIGLAVTVISILSQQIKKMNLSMAEKKEMDYLISNLESVNSSIRADFSDVDPYYQEKITAAIPPVYNILSFVDAMESLSKKYSIKQTLNFSQPMPATNAPGPIDLMSITFSLTIEESNIESFTNYLRDFEKLPYFASINSISYVGGGKGGWQENSNINIVGSLYAHK